MGRIYKYKGILEELQIKIRQLRYDFDVNKDPKKERELDNRYLELNERAARLKKEYSRLSDGIIHEVWLSPYEYFVISGDLTETEIMEYTQDILDKVPMNVIKRKIGINQIIKLS